MGFASVGTGQEVSVDGFAGGGGMSEGYRMVFGRSPDAAINHSAAAFAMHKANHPNTQHFLTGITAIDPRDVLPGQPIGLLKIAPDCRHHSNAANGIIRSASVRDLADVVPLWAEYRRPRVILLENVEEWWDWGPLLPGEGKADPDRKGESRIKWVRKLRRLGYRVEKNVLAACEHGSPTSRKRLFVIARRDGEPIVWPQPTHGPGLMPFETTAGFLDFSQPTTSIFGRKKDLCENTLRRIAKGVYKFVVNNPNPFIVPGSAEACEDHRHLVAAYMAQHNGGYNNTVGRTLNSPVSTITTTGSQQELVTSHLMVYRNNVDCQGLDEPLLTVTAGANHFAEVRTFLINYNGTGTAHDVRKPINTITTRDRFYLVNVHGVDYAITDIRTRRLTPRELFSGQGFRPDYIIDPIGPSGRPLSKTAQIKCAGNAVPPHLAAALIRANYEPRYVHAPPELDLLEAFR